MPDQPELKPMNAEFLREVAKQEEQPPTVGYSKEWCMAAALREEGECICAGSRGPEMPGTITRTDIWLVYNGDPENLQGLLGKSVCAEIPPAVEGEAVDGAYGTLEDRSWMKTTHSSDGKTIDLCVVRGFSFTPLRKGDLIRVLPGGNDGR